MQRLIRSIHEQTAYRTGLLDAEKLVERLNRKLQGWANYFKLGPVSKAYRIVDQFTTSRLRRWLKHHAMTNYCARDLIDLRQLASRNLRSMQRRRTLVTAFWKQAELF